MAKIPSKRLNRPSLSGAERMRLHKIGGREPLITVQRLERIAGRLKSPELRKRQQDAYAKRRLKASGSFARAILDLEKMGQGVQLGYVAEANEGHMGMAYNGISYKGKSYQESHEKAAKAHLNYVKAFARNMAGTREGAELAKGLEKWRAAHIEKFKKDYAQSHSKGEEIRMAARALEDWKLDREIVSNSQWDQMSTMEKLDRFSHDFISEFRAWERISGRSSPPSAPL
jgi:hypothetical protein